MVSGFGYKRRRVRLEWARRRGLEGLSDEEIEKRWESSVLPCIAFLVAPVRAGLISNSQQLLDI